ncbi:hypothetical protein DIPPA_23805 [Diplonema papillatum]|nr:hypothetical protein DIPPA_23805 [Diplonema papillatum]
MGSGAPSFKILLASWVRENMYAAAALFTTITLALVYLYVCYIEPNPDLMQWMLRQTVNDKNGHGSASYTSGEVRLPTKYRMLNPLLLIMDYPICRWLTFDQKWKDLSFMSANLISLVHPLVGFAAAYVLVKAASPPKPHTHTAPDVRDVEMATCPLKNTEPVGYQSALLVKIAALLFTARNTLDTLDGVMARAQREEGQAIATGMGFNGHLLDVVTDMVGVTAFMMSVWYHYYKLRFRTEKHGLPGVREVVCKLSNMGLSPVSISRILTFFGLTMICLTGLSWETTMLKFQVLFDHATSPDLLALEKSPVVQACYFLWSLTCADTLFSYLIIALLCNVGHDWVVLLSIYGWGWLVFLSLYSFFVTRWLASHPVVLAAGL